MLSIVSLLSLLKLEVENLGPTVNKQMEVWDVTPNSLQQQHSSFPINSSTRGGFPLERSSHAANKLNEMHVIISVDHCSLFVLRGRHK